MHRPDFNVRNKDGVYVSLSPYASRHMRLEGKKSNVEKMEKLFHKALWACIVSFVVLLGSWSLTIDLRSTYFHTPLQGIAIHRRGMEFSADRVSKIPPPAPAGNKLGRRNPPPEPPPPPASPISYSPPVPPPPPAFPSSYPPPEPPPPPASPISYSSPVPPPPPAFPSSYPPPMPLPPPASPSIYPPLMPLPPPASPYSYPPPPASPSS